MFFGKKIYKNRYFYNDVEVLYAEYNGKASSLKDIRDIGFETPPVPISKRREITVQAGKFVFRVKAKEGFLYTLKDTNVFGYKDKKTFYKCFKLMP